VIRAVYSAFGPPLIDPLSGIHGALVLVFTAEVFLFAVGFILIATEQGMLDLMRAKERVWQADVAIAQHKADEAVLRESEARFRLLADSAPAMLWRVGPDQQAVDFNRWWLEFSGRPAEKELGIGWMEGVHPDDVKRVVDTANQFIRREPFSVEYRHRRHDGTYRWVLANAVPLLGPDSVFRGYIGSTIDIADQKDAEAALSRLSHRLIEAQEEERTRLARDLHDDFAQRTVGLAMQLHSVAQDLPSHTSEHRRLRQACDLASTLSADIQAVSHRLHSSSLDHLGLVVAAAGFCQELSEQHHLEIAFSHHGIPADMPKDIALCLFRVMQEGVTNAFKHSRSREFHVSLWGGVSEIELIVRDSGIGFDREGTTNRRGLGLTSMRERLKLVDGHLSIDSTPGRGTTLRARVPFSPKTEYAGAGG
jgi:PAS domain S-box-containing protein